MLMEWVCILGLPYGRLCGIYAPVRHQDEKKGRGNGPSGCVPQGGKKPSRSRPIMKKRVKDYRRWQRLMRPWGMEVSNKRLSHRVLADPGDGDWATNGLGPPDQLSNSHSLQKEDESVR
ncbi:hypothetical protein MPNT_20133 [Candidatus Methylacidithermus pantelleriae]|uniref:Uncharacterized protein n=1 Tax=Candidatus Methylacidithermus pantelleriae TaxID=2744239 RepID=A0A8J2BPC7_9BACT|nr:hypothetical protein MPNT_20133 [Candidatus Methylacidithermus pantelleriae]